MDGKYDITAMPFSLKTMCATKVVYRVLMASARERCVGPAIADDAARRVRELELPRDLIEILKNLLRPMMMEIRNWQKQFHSSAEDLIMTPFGTVDWIRSANAILRNKKTDKVYRFAVACYHCFEDVIYELFSEMTECERNFQYKSASERFWFPMVDFWKDVSLGKLGPVSTDGRLSKVAYNLGFQLAIEEHNDFAINHFISAVSPEIVSQWFEMSPFTAYNCLTFPSTFCLLVSKLRKTDQQKYSRYIAFHLLLMLMRMWPYQRFFVAAAQSLTSHVTEENYWRLVTYVLRKIADHRRDSDYYELFSALWLAGSCHRHGSTTLPCLSHVIYDVLMCQNERLVNFVLDETCTELKDVLLMKFSENKICIRLICVKEYRLLEMFIRCCGLRRKDVLLQFKSNFLAYYSSSSDETWFEDFKRVWKRDECEAGLRRFAEIVDNILSEKRHADNMIQ